MEIHYSKKFQKNFKKRILPNSSLEQRFKERFAIFIQDKTVPVLKDHKLIGKLQSYRAFSITGDVRVVYFEESNSAVTVIDIGTHNQVYK